MSNDNAAQGFTRARIWDMGSPIEQASTCVDLKLGNNAVAQIASIEGSTVGEAGFSIRVWGPNGTHEDGGGNLTIATLMIRFVDGNAELIQSSFYEDRGQR